VGVGASVLFAATAALSVWRAVVVQEARKAAMSQTDEFHQAAMAVRERYSRERLHQFLAATKKMADATGPRMRSGAWAQVVDQLAQCGWPPLWQGKDRQWGAMVGAATAWLNYLSTYMNLWPMLSNESAEDGLRESLKDEHLNRQEAFWRGSLLAAAAPTVATLSVGVLVCVGLLLVALVVGYRGRRTTPAVTGAPAVPPH
jgi:hypothetical protein